MISVFGSQFFYDPETKVTLKDNGWVEIDLRDKNGGRGTALSMPKDQARGLLHQLQEALAEDPAQEADPAREAAAV